VAADVLDWCGPSRSEPLALEGMRERLLPELAFRGRQNKKLQFAFLAAAARGRRLFPRRRWPRGRSGCVRRVRNWRGSTAPVPNEPSLCVLISGLASGQPATRPGILAELTAPKV